MKHFNFLNLLFLLFLLPTFFFSQNEETSDNMVNEMNYWQITPHIGYDFPSYDEDFEYIGYDGGINAGLSVNKYWSWAGFQFDFDYIQNKPKADNILNPLYIDYTLGNNGLSGVLGELNVRRDKISRMYLGIGPSFKYQSPSNRFIIDFALTAGMGKVDGGEILIFATAQTPSFNYNQLISYHTGFKDKWVFSIKPGVRFNYYFNEAKNVGIHAGFYYLRHFNVPEGGDHSILNDYLDELGEPPLPFDLCYYQSGISQEIQDGDGAATITYYNDGGEGSIVRGDTDNVNQFDGSCEKIDVASFGIYGGLSFRLFPNKKTEGCPHGTVYCSEHDECHAPPACCSTCNNCDISVTARDKISGQIMPNTDVVLVNSSGSIVNTGTTTSYGVVVFKDVAAGSYMVKGKYEDVDLQETTVSSQELQDCINSGEGSTIDKEILYTDDRFVLTGKVVECNTDVPIQGVDVGAKNTTLAQQMNTLSDNNGEFVLHVNQGTTYAVQGTKAGYFSNIVTVNTLDYDRTKTFQIKMNMCVDPCGKAIKLDNIHFDTAKWDIKPQSIPDLQYILKLMNENPNIIVEMSSHTDWRGTTEYNQDLSQKRANSTVDWLVSHGADRSRLRARGAGESEPVNNCVEGVQCTDAQLEQNRRTEFKVICPE